jgi:hypothetical protein
MASRPAPRKKRRGLNEAPAEAPEAADEEPKAPAKKTAASRRKTKD